MRRFLIAALATALAIGLVIGGTWASYSDTEASSGNTITSGPLDLKVGAWNAPFGDGVTATWTMSNMLPGVTTVGPFSVLLQNSATIAADHVEVAFSHSIDEATNPVESDTNPNSTSGEMARSIEITLMTYTGVDLKATYTDANGNGFFDLEDVTLSPYTDVGGLLDDLLPPPPNSGGMTTFTMTLAFHANATNDIQGDILTTTVTFTLNQEASQ